MQRYKKRKMAVEHPAVKLSASLALERHIPMIPALVEAERNINIAVEKNSDGKSIRHGKTGKCGGGVAG